MWLLMAGWTLVGLGGIEVLVVGRGMVVEEVGGGVVGGGGKQIGEAERKRWIGWLMYFWDDFPTIH